MEARERASLGLVLPVTITAILASLELLSFVHITISAAIAIDKLILLVVALCPITYAIGAVVSAVSLIKSPKKMMASVGLVLNGVLLTAFLYFGKSFLKEFNLPG